ncbi:hypothetical protein ACFY9C_34785 [Streptomyces filamentosus]|uniref:hypothetical protein n=1 Tax=Streptomyces filamentosus TaxID=67294 RepID=UPI0036E12B37
MSTTIQTTAAQFVDRRYTVPAPGVAASGCEEIARDVFDRIARWGHTVTGEAYIEEEAVNEYGRSLYDSRAMRIECVLDGRHRVVVRYDRHTVSPEVWSVTVDGEVQDLPPLGGQMLWRRIAALALVAHLGVERLSR